jgi:hypothetical protein
LKLHEITRVMEGNLCGWQRLNASNEWNPKLSPFLMLPEALPKYITDITLKPGITWGF